MKKRWQYFSIIALIVLMIGCKENATTPKSNPVVKITIDWNSLDNTANKVKTASLNNFGDTVTHFGVRLIYVNENAVFTQSVEKTTAEVEGIITLDVPATNEANLFSVAVRKTQNEEKVFLLGAIQNLSIEQGNEYNWTVDDFNWETAEWEVVDSLKSVYESGEVIRGKNDYDFKLWYLVNNPFNSASEVEYEELIIKINGTGGPGGYTNGSREYFIQAINPDQGTTSETTHSFYPYLDGQKFNLPVGRYMVQEEGFFKVKWE